MDRPAWYQQLRKSEKHLPYAESIEDEALKQFAEIKHNLGTAVLLHEIDSGIIVWGGHLDRYIKTYGYKFSKEDHLSLIKLFFKILISPDLGPFYVKGVATYLVSLLKKPKLITRDDLEIPWRPLYSLVYEYRDTKTLHMRVKRFPSKYLETLLQIVKCARRYFNVSATKEMLLAWRPLMCAFDATKVQAAFYFSTFLPTCLPADQQDQGFRLWIDEFLEYWFYCTHGLSTVTENYVKLFHRATTDNVGAMDWNPYLPKIFNHFLSSLNLPVNGSIRQRVSQQMITYHCQYVRWFVYMIDARSQAVDYLERLFTSLKSFFHPSNHGSFSSSLLSILTAVADSLVSRLHFERYAAPVWHRQIPVEHHITDDTIERIVLTLRDICFLAMYSKVGSANAAVVLQCLALLRADLVVPQLLDRTLEALETIVEPHQVTATIQCVYALSHTLVEGGNHPASATRIMQLLYALLPGIDPNDFRKSMSALSLIVSVVGQIPLVDCMQAVHNGVEMTEIEKELCVISSQFEDYLLLVLDRCFVLIENLSVEELNGSAENTNKQEDIIGTGIATLTQRIFVQASPQIYKTLLDSLFTFVTTRVLEVSVAGKVMATMCRGSVKPYPDVALQKFLPYLCSTVSSLATVAGVENEEEGDPKLLWFMEVLSQLVCCGGSHLLAHKERVFEVLSLTLKMKCKKVYLRAAEFLKQLLIACCDTFIDEYRNTDTPLDRSPLEHLYVRDWGATTNMAQVQPEWHTSCKEEVDFANELLQTYLKVEVKVLEQFIDGSLTLDKEDLHRRIKIISYALNGCASLLPQWAHDTPIDWAGLASSLPRHTHPLMVQKAGVHQLPPLCVERIEIADLIHRLYERLKHHNEDDVKALRQVAQIYACLQMYYGVDSKQLQQHAKNKKRIKTAMNDKLYRGKRVKRALLLDKLMLLHEGRVAQTSRRFTQTDHLILTDILQLSTSAYTEVRMEAQKVLTRMFSQLHNSRWLALPHLLDNLREDPAIAHETLKGSLYVLLNDCMMRLLAYQRTTWPALVRANHSEKSSIITLLYSLCYEVTKRFSTLGDQRELSSDCVELASNLLSSKGPSSQSTLAESACSLEELISQADAKRLKDLTTRIKSRTDVHLELVNLVQSKTLHWRGVEYGLRFLLCFLSDTPTLPQETVQLFVNLLVSDTRMLRKVAIHGVNAILFRNKPRFEKEVVDYQSQFGFTPTDQVLMGFRPGDDREDLQKLHFSWDTQPHSQDDLEQQSFVDKTHWGYRTWPRELKTYAPACLKSYHFNPANPMHAIFQRFFTEEEEDLFKLLSMEHKKGEDQFCMQNYKFFTYTSMLFGASLLPAFKARLTQLLTGNSVESHHRCAIELLAGMLRGSKNWCFDDLRELYDFLCPLLSEVFATNIIPEVLKDWSTGFIESTESRDPNRLHDILRTLLNNPLSGEGGALGDSSRLHITMHTLAQQEWRVPKINHELLEYLRGHLSHLFKSVRSRVGCQLSRIFMYDLEYGGFGRTASPRLKDFIDSIMPDLQDLQQEVYNNVNQHVVQGAEERSEEYKRKDRLAKTVFTFLTNMAYLMQPVSKEIVRMLPVLMALEAREDDKDIIQACKATLIVMASRQLTKDVIEEIVPALKQVCSCNSWNAKKAALNYFKVMLFHNMFTFEKESIKNEITEIIHQCIRDEQLEVRENASTLLSGLVHYGYIQVTSQLCEKFSKMARTKLKNIRHGVTLTPEQVQQNTHSSYLKHGGVLGLGACVMAYPYDVPTWMPDVLIQLGTYTHSTNSQVQITAKKALSEFRRTHHDNWHTHRLQFTEDQLSEVTDFLASPSYYA